MNETRTLDCQEVAALLPGLVDDPGMSLALRRHVSRCTGCSAELESYRALRTATTDLVEMTAAPPPGLRDALVAIPAGVSRLSDIKSHVTRHRGAYAGALVALGATAGAAVWRSRRRGLATA